MKYLVLLLFIIYLFFWDGVSQCSPEWFGTQLCRSGCPPTNRDPPGLCLRSAEIKRCITNALLKCFTHKFYYYLWYLDIQAQVQYSLSRIFWNTVLNIKHVCVMCSLYFNIYLSVCIDIFSVPVFWLSSVTWDQASIHCDMSVQNFWILEHMEFKFLD